MKQRFFGCLTTAMTVLAGGLAHADPVRDPGMANYARWLDSAQHDQSSPSRGDAARCHKDLATAREAKLPDTYEMTSDAYAIIPKSYKTTYSIGLRFGDAGAICDGLDRAVVVVEARKAVAAAKDGLKWLDMIDVATTDPRNADKLIDTAKKCSEAVKVLVDAKRTQVSIADGDTPLPVSEIEVKYCTPLATRAARLTDAVKQAKAERLARIAAPYKAAGIKGEKLDFLIERDGYAIYGVGGDELGPKEIAKANVLFDMVTDDDGIVTVRRYAFKVDKLIKTSSKRYLRQPGSNAYR